MSGVITTRHLILHADVIVREFGWRIYGRCVVRSLLSPRPVTFVECVFG